MTEPDVLNSRHFSRKKTKFAIRRKYLHSWRTMYLFNICCNVFFSNGLSWNGSTSPHSGLNVWKGHGGFCIFTVGIWGHGGGLWSLIGFLKKKVKLSTFDLAFKWAAKYLWWLDALWNTSSNDTNLGWWRPFLPNKFLKAFREWRH